MLPKNKPSLKNKPLFVVAALVLFIAAFALLTFSSCLGCSALDSGPKVMRQVGEGAITVATTLASQMSPKNLTASASGDVKNPEYQCSGFVGTGVQWNLTIRLIGADLDFDIAGAGAGKSAPDERLLSAITEIQGRPDLTGEAKSGMVGRIIAEWLASRPAKAPGLPHDAPSPSGGP